MFDLHSHILPGVDDGSASMEMSLEMARVAVSDGITHMACTPHITPGIYANDTRSIETGVTRLREALAVSDIALNVVVGADIHVSPDLVERLSQKTVPSLNGSRYFLFEPPHHVKPPHFERFARELMNHGFVPVLTHPERLSWIEDHYDAVCALGEAGIVIQLTAGAVTGGFGSRPKYWSERMLDEGRVGLIASDAHDPKRRPPILSRARDAIATRHGDEAACLLTVENGRRILADEDVADWPESADK